MFNWIFPYSFDAVISETLSTSRLAISERSGITVWALAVVGPRESLLKSVWRVTYADGYELFFIIWQFGAQ